MMPPGDAVFPGQRDPPRRPPAGSRCCFVLSLFSQAGSTRSALGPRMVGLARPGPERPAIIARLPRTRLYEALSYEPARTIGARASRVGLDSTISTRATARPGLLVCEV